MARIRTIKPEFFTSADIVSLTPLARLFYVSLWCEADRDGRLEWKPATLKLRYLPGDNCDVKALSGELVDAGLVLIYEVDGKQFAEIPSFTKHQVINNRETVSRIPARVVHASPTRGSRVLGEGKGKEGKGKEDPHTPVPGDDDPPGFAEFWSSWPKSQRKVDRSKCAAKWKRHRFDRQQADILAHVEAMKHSAQWLGGFEPAPLTYLNGERWGDGVPEDGAPGGDALREIFARAG